MLQLILLIAPVVLIALLLELLSRRSEIVLALRARWSATPDHPEAAATPSGSYDGAPYWCRESTEAVGGDTVPVVTLSLMCPSTQILRVERRKPGPRPLAPHPKECVTHDSDFDSALIVFGSAGGVTPRALRVVENRIAIRKLFELGCGGVTLDGTMLTAVWRGDSAADGCESRWLEAALSYMTSVRHNITPETVQPLRPALFDWGELNRSALQLGGAIFAVALIVAAVGLHKYPPVRIDGMLVVAIVVSLAIGWRSYAIEVREANGGLPMWGRIRLLVGLLATYAVVLALLLFANGFEDRGAFKLHSAQVIGVSKLAGYHRVALSGWDEGDPTSVRQILVDPDLYRRVFPGETQLLVTTRPGRLSFEWVWSAKVLDELFPVSAETDPVPVTTSTPTLSATPSATPTRPRPTATAVPPTPSPDIRPTLLYRSSRRAKKGSFEWSAEETPRR